MVTKLEKYPGQTFQCLLLPCGDVIVGEYKDGDKLWAIRQQIGWSSKSR